MQELDTLEGVPLRHRVLQGDGVRLHAVEAGTGPLVLLLHGFPEFWYGWRFQLPALARAGFRVVAPDMRGYNLSDKPARLADYRTQRLAADVVALVRALGEERAAVVGHDWGGVVAWVLAAQHPEVVERLVILNAPHPQQFRATLLRPAQLLRSWYAGFFQLPVLPEAVLRMRDYALLRRTLQAEARRPGAFTPEDVERYVEAFRQPGALTAAINYYRATSRHGASEEPLRERPVHAPVLVIWGRHDPHLLPDLARPDPRYVRDARVQYVDEAAHFVQHDAPARVNALVTEFLQPLLPRARSTSAAAERPRA